MEFDFTYRYTEYLENSIDVMKIQNRTEDHSNGDPRWSRIEKGARSALDKGNESYVLELCSDLLARFPENVDVRRLLWDARVASKARDLSHVSFITRIRKFVAESMLSGNRGVKHDPAGAIVEADRVLALDPHNRRALLITLEASRALGWLETALMACEQLIECRDHRPPDVVTAVDLFLELGKATEAVKLCECAVLRFSGDPSIRNALRRASVRRSMSGTGRARSEFTDGS